MSEFEDYARREYVGKGQERCNDYKQVEGAWTRREQYIASDGLVKAVNLALYLKRPLLLEGEPGCGKTRLARSIAYELGYPLKECYIRSTSRAQDLLYTYDAVRRLYDVHESSKNSEKSTLPSRKEYVTLGELGEAIALAEKDTPSVVLIDEIDKADIDFPNDLLMTLEQWKFEAEEAREKKGNKKIELKHNAIKDKEFDERKPVLPLVIITSNREKELPAPFLRRCLFYYIEFPEKATLEDILDSHFPGKVTSALFEAALEKFLWIRQHPQIRLRKNPSTSELLDWIKALESDEQQGKLTAKDLEAIKSIESLPHPEVLLKTVSDFLKTTG